MIRKKPFSLRSLVIELSHTCNNLSINNITKFKCIRKNRRIKTIQLILNYNILILII